MRASKIQAETIFGSVHMGSGVLTARSFASRRPFWLRDRSAFCDRGPFRPSPDFRKILSRDPGRSIALSGVYGLEREMLSRLDASSAR